MHLALLTTFAAGRKDPLAEMLDRVYSAIIAGGFGEPALLFTLLESPHSRVSSVDRALKRFPELRAVERRTEATKNGIPSTRVLTNRPNLGGTREVIPFNTLLEVARGVPRTFPFNDVAIHFVVRSLSGGLEMLPTEVGHDAGISVTDSWWISGRQRSLSALAILKTDPSARQLPKLPDEVTALFAACGKMRKTIQLPLADMTPTLIRPAIPESGQAITATVQECRTKMPEIVERAGLPHDLPSIEDALRMTPLGQTAGPRKPPLVAAFKPLGYNCHGESGTFTLRRRTRKNLTLELYLDVGSWSHLVSASFAVHGMIGGRTFVASRRLPVAARAMTAPQYPIGDAERWRQIVENLTALVIELERTFVPAVEDVSGPAPEWYRPER